MHAHVTAASALSEKKKKKVAVLPSFTCWHVNLAAGISKSSTYVLNFYSE